MTITTRPRWSLGRGSRVVPSRWQATAEWVRGHGGAPMVNRKVYFDASPISYVTVDKNGPRFLLLYGHEDDIADPKTQSERFLLALKQAGFFARAIVVPGAGHFWSVDAVDEGFGAYAGPKVLRFLEGAL